MQSTTGYFLTGRFSSYFPSEIGFSLGDFLCSFQSLSIKWPFIHMWLIALKWSPCIRCHTYPLTCMYKILFQFHPLNHVKVINASCNGNTWRHIKCMTTKKHHFYKSHIFNNLNANSSMMIFFPIDPFASWEFKTQDYNLAFPPLLWSFSKTN